MMDTWIIVLGAIVLAVILYASKNRSKILKRDGPKEYEESKRMINSNK